MRYLTYDRILDTMQKSNTGREVFLMNKAYTLIIQGKEKMGHDLLREVYEQEDTLYKRNLAPILIKSRKELIDSLSFE